MAENVTITKEQLKAISKPISGHWNTDEGVEMAKAYVGKAREDLAYGQKSDLELANAVYMVGRDDPGLVGLQTAAKERIRWLSVQLALALQSLDRQGVAVKPLEWDLNGDAKTALASYHVEQGMFGWQWSCLTGIGGFAGAKPAGSEEAAKAGAEADHERRVLSALAPQPPATGHEPRQEAVERPDLESTIKELLDTSNVADPQMRRRAAFMLIRLYAHPSPQPSIPAMVVDEAMVERAAQHLALEYTDSELRAEYSWDESAEYWKMSWRRKARAVLTAALGKEWAMETRPTNCRFRLKDEGKAYPRSSCPSCRATIGNGLGAACRHGVYIPTVDPSLMGQTPPFPKAKPTPAKTDIGGLVERLRYRVNNPSAWPEGFDQVGSDLFSQAADALSASEARIAELERDMDTLEYLHSERDRGEKIVDEKLAAAEARIGEVTKALEFYADPESYREQSRDDWSKENPGRDPTVAIRCGRFSVEAKAGFVIAPIYHDNQGDRARKALESEK